MKLYIVAKTPTSGYIGQMSIEDILAKLKANEISGDYVTTEFKDSYVKLVKRTDVQWEPVAKLFSTPSSSESVAPQPGLRQPDPCD
jgi:hypothetical protein